MFNVTDAGAKLVEFDEDSSDDEASSRLPQQQSRLRKLTSVPLSQGDKRYAGKSSSRSDWLADDDDSGNTNIATVCTFRDPEYSRPVFGP